MIDDMHSDETGFSWYATITNIQWKLLSLRRLSAIVPPMKASYASVDSSALALTQRGCLNSAMLSNHILETAAGEKWAGKYQKANGQSNRSSYWREEVSTF